MGNSLKGLTVVNTRPSHQAHALNEIISQEGGELVSFPVIEIIPPENSDVLKNQFKKLKYTDIAIFVSANAVDAAIVELGGAEYWPENIIIASVGRATASKLEAYGLAASIIAPEPFNSEALLRMPELENVSSKNILIFRGVGGREYMAKTLRSRGANVDYVECYRRVIPDSESDNLYQCWSEDRKLIIVVTSNEGLRNLITMVDKKYRDDLLVSKLVVVSERTISLAGELGFDQKPLLVTTVSNKAIVESIQHWFK